mmetsp:Transcript_40283/g.77229  ORF Transcript_40283/g.77229 Transcript_40283/m.77229 type:complete len:247 (-) Transcript_40283:792-1532(-)
MPTQSSARPRLNSSCSSKRSSSSSRPRPPPSCASKKLTGSRTALPVRPRRRTSLTMPVPLKTAPVSSRMPSIRNSVSPSHSTHPGKGGVIGNRGGGLIALPQTTRLPRSTPCRSSSSPPSPTSSPSSIKSRPSASRNRCFSRACFAGLNSASTGRMGSMPKVRKAVTASVTAQPRTRAPSTSSMPAKMKGATSSSVQKSSGLCVPKSSSSITGSSQQRCASCGDASLLRRPGKLFSRKFTESRMPK